MTCPFHDTDDGEEATGREAADGPSTGRDPDERGIDRRAFLRSALAIGGTGALSTVIDRFGMPGTARAAEHDPIGVAERANRQHAWERYLRRAPEDGQATAIPPEHHLLLLLDYRGSGEPSAGHRRQVERALRGLERAFGWRHDGLLFTIGYSPSYFDRFDEPLPEGLDPDREAPTPQALLRNDPTIEASAAGVEDPDEITAESYDACLHLASDHVQNLLAAEAMLWGDREAVNGVTVEATFEGVFERPEEYPARRTGFVGRDNLAAEFTEDGDLGPGVEDPDLSEEVPEDADLSMGFNALFDESVPRETNATLLEDQRLVEPKPPGLFAQGTIQHVSKLDIDLDRWHDHDRDRQRSQMFSPHHSEQFDDAVHEGTDAEGVEETLDGSNAPLDGPPTRDADSEAADLAERTPEDADSEGVVGHVQKIARARFDIEDRFVEETPEDDPARREVEAADGGAANDLETPMLRRDFDTTDQRQPGLHFVSLMRFNGYMVYVRQAMNGVEFDTESFALGRGERFEDEGGFRHDALDVDDEANGLVDFLDTRRRGNFLVPPLTHRALPFPRARTVDVDVERSGDRYVAEVTGDGLLSYRIDLDSVRFGHYRAVNRGQGVAPVDVSRDGRRLRFEFPVAGTGLEDDDGAFNNSLDRARLVARAENDRQPVRGTDRL